ncbi:FKBP-type peptidyl-prolyl cis-trans isomerase [Pelagicoccus mobilis]|uniref:Peptidyl-prolyl cis-trans isomerase n=1 Tax=Pelagicoccus mobilis TaxID=415221 RepID=A0A934RW66_9BACT|nr:FKBP-type peptidyl-prolyl cis-trans isomerase [Pelagicoccus mobilis]MBK1878860.1 FKBP-type peptidyl-prolyl cis-trans isomerase [Pelagicoccus mobilis]
MRKILAISSFFAAALPSFGQLADLIPLPEEMEQEEPTYTDEELLRSWGWLLAERFNLRDLELDPQEIDWISAGMMSHVDGEQAPTDLRESQFALQEYFSKREVTIQARQLEENTRAGEEFFDSLFGTPGMLSLATGLFYQIKEPGSEVRPTETDTVLVRYEGRFLDNTVFDSTEDKGPITFKLSEVIPAWTQGIPLIGEGGKIKLYVPSRLGYGDDPRPGIPPASTLIFEVELLKVLSDEEAKAAAAEAAAQMQQLQQQQGLQ